jgi:hypothetical protein
MDSMEFNPLAHGFHGFHGFHGIHGSDVRPMVVISPKHLTCESTGVMAYRAGSAGVSDDRSPMTAGVRFCGSHGLAHRALTTRRKDAQWLCKVRRFLRARHDLIGGPRMRVLLVIP